MGWLIRQGLKPRMKKLEFMQKNPIAFQDQIFKNIINKAKNTSFGKKYGFSHIQNYQQFCNQVPVRSYEELYPYIEKILKGESDVLWPGKIQWFAKSSGTTNDKSKFIPISKECLNETHFEAGKDMLALYLMRFPDTKVFSGKILSIGGSNQINPLNEHSQYGDLSAVLIQNLPFFYEWFRLPGKEIALMSEWEAKIKKMAEVSVHANVSAVAGVPTWTVVLIETLLKMTGQPNMNAVWPHWEAFFHGAVSFKPYKKQFQNFAPNLKFMEIYNASEGYFGIQSEDDDGMLVMANHGIFYEFISLDSYFSGEMKSIPLAEVELGQQYALVISTNTGLWRYLIGDTVKFTSLYPHKFIITGRTKHFINAFGEELMVDNSDTAIAKASALTGATVRDYTAAPIYFGSEKEAGHEWIIEFETEPSDFNKFTELLDAFLQEINTDYAAKRYKNIALKFPVFHKAPAQTFSNWLKSKGKLGGQHKVPRLMNDRTLLEEILSFV